MSTETVKKFQFLKNATAHIGYSEGGQFRCFVEGVKCSHCLQRIESAFLTHPEVKNVRMDMGKSILTFDIEPNADLSELASKVDDLGFPTTPLKVNQSEEQALKKATRQSLYRIAVAGVAAGNIMLLSVSLYSGADQSEFRSYFEWVSALLFLPVLFYSAIPFYRVAFSDIKKRQISIDLPIVIAIIGGAILSIYHLIATGGDIYFDSLAVLVFLLLSSRHFLDQLQKHYLNPKYLQSFLTLSHVSVKTETGWEERPVEALQPDDEILLQKGDQIPADGHLLNLGGYINSSVLTGESLPEPVGPRQSVFAGTTWMSSATPMVVKSLGDSTRMGQIFKEMEKELMTKTPLLTLTDRVAKYFTFVILSISAVFLASYLLIDAEEAIRRSLALIILACPCALALATPLTQSLALMKSAKLGAVLKNASALESLFKIKNVVFDKTGTLTTGQMRLTSIGQNLMTAEDELALVALETQSSHPVAFCLVDYFSTEEMNLPAVTDFKQLSQGGVSADIGGHRYLARRSTTQSANNYGTSVDFYKDARLIAQFQFADKIRSNSLHAIQQLELLKYDVHLLTGDLKNPAQQVGYLLGIPENHIYDSKSPEEKQSIIKSLPNTMMVGDGVNDAVALASANVGISVHGSMKNSLAASDIYLTQSGIDLIPNLLILARETRHVIQRNLILSVIYNITFGVLALTGYVNPLVAAILMPISSVTVLISSVWGTQVLRQLIKKNKSSKKSGNQSTVISQLTEAAS